jgi:hypothetical protein
MVVRRFLASVTLVVALLALAPDRAASAQARASEPVGYVDVAIARSGLLHFAGWAGDPDAR